jgi:uncharacterized protein YjcR
MAKTYSDEIHRKAKIMWLSGNYKSDKEIARLLEITRPNTIQEWGKAENWEAERAATVKEVNRKVDAVLAESMAEMQRRHLREYQAMQTKPVLCTAPRRAKCRQRSSARRLRHRLWNDARPS